MRVFFNTNEITKQTDRYDSSNFAMTYLAGNYLYIASDFPFNHFWVNLPGVKNDVVATMKVEYYGSSWNEVVNLKDETNALSSSGYVEFTPNKNIGWACLTDSTTIGLPVVYDKYWMRISFNVGLKAGVELGFIGNKFSDDTDLFSEFPIFNDSNYQAAFQVGKTDWVEQHIKAGELIIQDLEKLGVILGPEQILEVKRFRGASVCKVAEIIYTAFGNDYLEQRKLVKEEYSKRMNLSQFKTDQDNNAILSPSDVMARQGWLRR